MKRTYLHFPVAALIAAATSAHATIFTWTGATDTDFNTTTNWTGGTVMTTGATGAHRLAVTGTNKLTYTGTQGSTIYTGDGGPPARGLVIAATGGTGHFEIAGGTFSTVGSVGGPDLITNTAGAGGTLTVSGGQYISTALGLIVANNNTGTFTVSGGTATISGGGINLNAAGASTAVATLNLNGGVLEVSGSIREGVNATATSVNLNGGTLRALADHADFISNTFENGKVKVGDGGAIIDTNGFNVTAAAQLAADGTGGLTKNGAGALSLGGDNTYTGDTIVNAGILLIGNNGTTGSLPAGTSPILADGTSFGINRSDNLTQSIFTGAGPAFQSGLGGDVNFTKTGSGGFTADVANSYTGATTISGGTLLVTHVSALGSAGGANTTTNGATLALSGGINITGENITVSTGQGNNFRGVLQSFSGSNTFSGDVTIATTTGETRIGSQDNASLTLNGNITADGTGIVIFRPGENGVITLNGTASSWAGSTGFFGGANSILKNGVDNALSTGSAFSMGNSGLATAITYDLNGFNQTVAGLAHLNGTPAGTNTITNNGSSDSILTLDGTIDRSFSGTITDGNSNKISLVKQGDFTQTLNGTLNYTGATTISAGTLLLNGYLLGDDGVTVASGATLGGNAVIDTAIQSEGTISPGNGDIGALFTLDVDLSSGTLACEIDGFSSDLLGVLGDLDLTGATISVTPVGEGFTEARYVLAHHSGILTGTPALVGAPGYAIDTSVSGEIAITGAPVSGYDGWASTFLPEFTGPNATAETDFDNDDILNVLEYVLGGDPRVSDPSILPDLAVTDTGFVFTFKRNDDSENDTTQTFQWSANLVDWESNQAVVPAANATVNGAVFEITENGAEPDDVSVTIPRGANPKLFGRLKVTKP